VPYDNVGFRVAARSDVFSLTGVYIPSTGSTLVYIPTGQFGSLSTYNKLNVGMDIDGIQFSDSTKIQRINTSLRSFTGETPASGTYNTVNLTLVPVATGSNLTITASMDNPLHLKNMVLVDSSGNNPDGFEPGYGRINYNYRIGKYPVTNSEYTLFLNEVAQAIGTNAETNSLVYYSPANGLNRDGKMANGIYREKLTLDDRAIWQYFVNRHMEDKPVVGVTWLQAARYCNWLDRRVVFPDTTNTDTGAYNLRTPLNSMPRSSHARYFLPSESEWYKAAYYGKESSSFVYRKFATRTNTIPSQIPSVNKYGEAPFKNLTDISLFDRFSFDRIGNLRWVSILNAAADRWDKYLSHVEYSKVTDTDAHAGFRYAVKDRSRYEKLVEEAEFARTVDYFHKTSHLPRQFKGLALDQFTYQYSTFNNILSCGPMPYAIHTIITPTQPRAVLPTQFGLSINSRFDVNTYSDDEWIEIMVNALGRALGFGTLWYDKDPTNGIVSNKFMDMDVFPHTNAEYNRVAYGSTGGYTRKYTPLQQTNAYDSGYFEDDYLTDGECFTPLNCAVDTPYVGIKDIMNSTYRKGEIISNITIANMVDLGYYSKDNTFAGEGDFQPIYSGIDPSSAP
jgi:hypothetical protein